MSTPLNINSEGTENDSNEEIKRDKDFPKRDEQQEQDRDFRQIVNNNTDVDKDPTAYRSAGARGYRQRTDQMDDLDNLHIGGSEISPQGGNRHEGGGPHAQGPGFEVEGSYELDHSVRTREQKFGEEPSEERTPPPTDQLKD